MFQDVFRHSDVLALPVLSLVLFAVAFALLAIRGLRTRVGLTELAALPLLEDAGPLSAPKPRSLP